MPIKEIEELTNRVAELENKHTESLESQKLLNKAVGYDLEQFAKNGNELVKLYDELREKYNGLLADIQTIVKEFNDVLDIIRDLNERLGEVEEKLGLDEIEEEKPTRRRFWQSWFNK